MQVLVDLPSMDARGLSITLAGLAHMNYQQASPEMVEAIAEQIDARLDQFAPETFGGVLWGLAVISKGRDRAFPLPETLDRVGLAHIRHHNEACRASKSLAC